MTVKDLRTLIDNLDEYIHIPGGIERLKKTVLHLAVSGQLVPQDPNEGTGEEFYQQIQAEKTKLIKEGELKKQKNLSEIIEEEVPFQIPKSWKWVRLGNLVPQFQNGISSRGDKNGVKIVVLRLADIKQRRVSLANTRELTISPEDVERYRLVKGDVLITRVNGSADIVGSFSLCDRGYDAIYCDHFIRMRIRQDWLDPEFCKLLGDSIFLRNMIKNLFITTAGQKTVNQGHISSLIIPLIPLAEQKRIVRKVDALFALIDKLAAKYAVEQAERQKLVASSLAHLSRGNSDLVISHLTEIIRTKSDVAELRKSILRLAVSGQLTTQDPDEGTGEDLYLQLKDERKKFAKSGKGNRDLAEIADNETPFRIPTTWKWVTLQDVGQIIGGGTPSSTNSTYYIDNHQKGIGWLTPADLRNYESVYISHGKRSITEQGLRNSSARLMPRGTILFSSRAPIGHIAIAANEITTNQGFKSIVPYGNLDSEYIFRWLQFYGPVIDANASGTTFREVSGAIVARQPIPLPPLLEQARIATRTAQLLHLLHNLEIVLDGKKLTISSIERLDQPQAIRAKQGSVVNENDESQVLTNQQKKVQRKMLACFVANESLDGSQFGKTKFEKLLHLVEYHVLKRDLNQRYSVQPAGPYDGGFTRLFWDDVIRSKWFQVEDYGNLQKIVAGDNHEKSQKEYGYLSEDEKSKIRDLIKMFSNWGYGEAEIISTLYAVWNNRLIKGEEINDDLLKQDFLRWDPQKAQYSDRLDQALAWMRQNNIIPDGWGNEIKRAKRVMQKGTGK